jgi:hypothetical protein
MFRWARKTIELFKLDREERKLDKDGRRKQAEAAEKKDPAIFEEWENNYGDYIYADIRWARKKVVSDALMGEADDLLLPRPQFGDQPKWENEDDAYGMPRGFVLTPEAVAELRASIRKEKKGEARGF